MSEFNGHASESNSPEFVSSVVENVMDQEERRKARPLVDRVASEIRERFMSNAERALGMFTPLEREKAEAFFEGGKDTEVEIPISDEAQYRLLQRINGTEQLALFYLVTSGRLALEARSVASKARTNETAAAVDIAESFLEQVRLRNRESGRFKDTHLPSIGLEAEFILSALAPSKLDYKRWKLGGKSDLALRNPERPVQQEDYPDKPKILTRNRVGKDAYKYYREVSTDKTVGEIALLPSAFPSAQLRDILHLMQADIISRDSLTVHINVGGLELSRSQTQPMEVSSIIAGCDWIKPIFAQSSEPSSILELYSKRSDDASHDPKGDAYPLHRGRLPKRSFKPGTNDSSVEYRGNTTYDRYPDLVRGVESTYWLSTAAMARQRVDNPEYANDPVNQELAAVWDTFSNNWTQFYYREILIY